MVDLFSEEFQEKVDPPVSRQIPSAQKLAPVDLFEEESFAAEVPQEQIPLGEGVARSAAQGALFGFSDELEAVLDTFGKMSGQIYSGYGSGRSPRDLYQESLADIRAKKDRFEKDRGKTALASELVGGLATGGIITGAPKQGLKELSKQGAITGGAFGGAYGAGTADDGERVEGAVKGALIGAPSGAIAPSVINALGSAGRGAIDRVKNIIGRGTTDEEAASIIQDVAISAEINPQQVIDQMADYGSKATLADVDDNFARTLKNSLDKFTKGKTKIKQSYRERLQSEEPETISLLSERFGGYNSDDIFNALEDEAISRTQQAKPLYESAFSKNIPGIEKELATLNETAAFPKAMKQAEKYFADDLEKIGEAGKPLTNVERLHYAKQALWDQEGVLRRSGKDQAANRVANIRDRVTNILNKVPEYDQARQIWSSSKDAERAAEIGMNIFSKKGTRDFINEVSKMNPHELERAKMGALSSAIDKIEGTRSGRSVAQVLTENTQLKNKVKALFGNEDVIKDLEKTGETWGRFRQVNNFINSGNITKEMQDSSNALNKIINSKSSMKAKAWDFLTGWMKNTEKTDAKTHARIASILSKQGLTDKEINQIFRVQELGRGSQLLSEGAAKSGLIYENKKELIK